MEDRKDERYLNFPIKLLAGLLTVDKDIVLHDILTYSLYTYSLKLLEGNEDQKRKATLNFFAVKTTDKRFFENGKAIADSLPENSPMTGISLKVFWDYYKQEKTTFECAVLAAYCALKSIIGKQPYIKIDNLYLLSRMDGNAKSVKDYMCLSSEVFGYATSFKIRKIKDELVDKWGLKTYGRYTRGFYVSFSMELDALVFEAEKRRKKAKIAYLKKKENDAVLKALEKIKAMNL